MLSLISLFLRFPSYFPQIQHSLGMLFKICCKAPYQEDLQGKVKSAPFVLCAKKRLKTRLISYCNVQAYRK